MTIDPTTMGMVTPAPPTRVDVFNERIGLLVRGMNEPTHGDIEFVATMPPGLYVSVIIRGRFS